MQPTTTEQSKARVFYTQGAAALAVPINRPMRVLENGNSKVIGGDYIEFTPMGFNSDFGMIVTSNPDAIAVLEKRPDVFDAAELNRRMMTPDARAKKLEADNTRLVQENNRLLALLKNQDQQRANARAADSEAKEDGNRLLNPTSKKG